MKTILLFALLVLPLPEHTQKETKVYQRVGGEERVLVRVDSRQLAIQKYYSSMNLPLEKQANIFVEEGDEHGVDPFLMAAIGMIESTGGKNCLGKYNCYGMKGMSFANHREAIGHLAEILGTRYYYKGKSVDEISRVYCPPTQKIWAGKVKRQIAIMQQYKKEFDKAK